MGALCTKSIKNAFNKLKEELIIALLNNWMEILKNKRVHTFATDVSSVMSFVDSFSRNTGEHSLQKDDMRAKNPELIGILKEIKSSPNNLQFAIS